MGGRRHEGKGVMEKVQPASPRAGREENYSRAVGGHARAHTRNGKLSFIF